MDKTIKDLIIESITDDHFKYQADRFNSSILEIPKISSNLKCHPHIQKSVYKPKFHSNMISHFEQRNVSCSPTQISNSSRNKH